MERSDIRDRTLCRATVPAFRFAQYGLRVTHQAFGKYPFLRK